MSPSCSSCFKPKANLTCRECESPVCKHCAQFVDEVTYPFLAMSPENQFAGIYCPSCFEKTAASAMSKHQEVAERAGNVSVFFSDQGQETRTIKRSDFKFKVDECPDRDETVLRLAFQAAQAGFNGLVDVTVTYTKVREGSFKLASWSGTGTAAKIDNAEWFSPNGRRSPSR